jgi:hypothetical protein
MIILLQENDSDKEEEGDIADEEPMPNLQQQQQMQSGLHIGNQETKH